MDHPVVVFVGAVVLLLALGWPFLHVRLNAPDARILPASVPSRQAFDTLAGEFQIGEFGPLLLAVRARGPVTDPANVGLLYDYSRRIAADPRVSRVESVVDIDPRLDREQYQLLLGGPGGPGDRYVADTLARTTDGDLTAFTIVTWYGPNDAEGRALVKDLRDPSSRLAPPAGLSVLVGGGAAEVVDVVDRIGADFPRTALFILLTTVPDPVRAAPIGRAAHQGHRHEHAVHRGQLRRPGLDLPGRQPLGAAGLHPAGLRGDDAAGDPVLRALRAVDGLRGLPAQPR